MQKNTFLKKKVCKKSMQKKYAKKVCKKSMQKILNIKKKYAKKYFKKKVFCKVKVFV